ncbi:MAG TPA: 23S rRNA (adenine(2503)-C(2))-methyltransferase RlmN, partial [Prevotella sp.]|nr:23S rRNA (adenine(2503)-C(2))-methyltransferase RlmN [Prevotella sp.]
MKKKTLLGMTLAELKEVASSLGMPAFAGGQIAKWIYGSHVKSIDEMTNISKANRARLAEAYEVGCAAPIDAQHSKDGTIKYLWRLSDGNCVETVLMRYRYGNTVCISTEVGCRMGCAFCASTIAGKVRDLRPSELLDQVLFTQLDSGREISNI